MNFLLFAILFASGTAMSSTDFYLSTTHVNITRQNEEGWQHELSGKHDLGRKVYVGLNGTYLERFSFFEKRYGAFLGYKASDRLTLEARYYLGEGDNEILPREQKVLSAYYSVAPGFTPYLVYRDNRYSITRVHMMNLGMEIEKIPNIILIPQVMSGKATFASPSGTENIYNYGLRAMYYIEKKFTAFVFGFQGKEASQGIVGRSNVLVDTKTAGFGGSWFFRDNFRVEGVLDHTDYKQFRNQFVTTTLNLYWTVD
ncbi:MAG: hypothetical protein V4598_03130 [Bdellovibrionota bacterium]